MWVRLGVTAFVPPVLLWLLLNIWNFHDLLYPNRSTKYFMDERMLLLLPIGIGILSVVSCLPYLAQNGRFVHTEITVKPPAYDQRCLLCGSCDDRICACVS